MKPHPGAHRRPYYTPRPLPPNPSTHTQGPSPPPPEHHVPELHAAPERRQRGPAGNLQRGGSTAGRAIELQQVTTSKRSHLSLDNRYRAATEVMSETPAMAKGAAPTSKRIPTHCHKLAHYAAQWGARGSVCVLAPTPRGPCTPRFAFQNVPPAPPAARAARPAWPPRAPRRPPPRRSP